MGKLGVQLTTTNQNQNAENQSQILWHQYEVFLLDPKESFQIQIKKQTNPKLDMALQSINLWLQYPSYTAPVKVRMLTGLSSICLGKLCWEKGKTKAGNTTFYEQLRKAGILAFSRNRIPACIKQFVISAINSATSQTSRGRFADMTVLWHHYCMDLGGTTNKVYCKYS